jgi:hypothetical protein
MIAFDQGLAPTATTPPPRIGPRRAYGETLGLFVVIFGTSVINALEDGWAAVFGVPPDWLAWWDPWLTTTDRLVFMAGVLWLIGLRPWQHLQPGIVAAGLVALVALRVAAAALNHQAPTAATVVNYLALIALTTALAGVLARRRGLTLTGFGLGREPDHDRRSTYRRAQEIGVLSLVGIVTSSQIAQILTMLPGVPNGRGGFAVNGIHDVLTMVIASIHAGICEEVVLVATLVTALEAARRPSWEIYAVGLGLRLGIHLYFGLSAPAALIMAAVNIWLFRRTRRLMPLVLAHVFVDLFVPIKIVGGPLALPLILAALIALDTFITRRVKAEPAAQEQAVVNQPAPHAESHKK